MYDRSNSKAFTFLARLEMEASQGTHKGWRFHATSSLTTKPFKKELASVTLEEAHMGRLNKIGSRLELQLCNLTRQSFPGTLGKGSRPCFQRMITQQREHVQDNCALIRTS